jgi:uncharacterized protein YndB with AHSA1/START domain
MITVLVNINASIHKVWDCFTNAHHIINWNFASPDWHCPKAVNEVKVGGKLCATMAAKDGSASFDLEAVYTQVETNKLLHYCSANNRKIIVTFLQFENTVTLTQSFDPENENSLELQQAGWQAILNNFKSYVENI